MLGKRVRWIPSNSTEPGKRLRRNLEDLWASGQTNTSRHAELLRDGLAAGVEECYSRAVARHVAPRPSQLFNEALKSSEWPRPKPFQVPLLNRTGEVQELPLAFLLPHELILALIGHGRRPNAEATLVALQEVDGLDSTCATHIAGVNAEWGVQSIPISLWQDGVPFNWDRSESLEVYSLAFPGMTQPGESGCRFPITVIPHHMCCKATHQRVWEILAWSFTYMSVGQCPPDGPCGQDYKHHLAGQPLGFHAAICEFKGDWKMMSEIVGLPTWNNKQGICWRCSMTLDKLHEVGEEATWRQPQSRLSHGDLLLQLQRKGPVCGIFSFPGFTSKLFRMDWLHAADLGITAKFFGAMLHLCIGLAIYGRNQEQRLAVVWKDMLAWYDSQAATNLLVKNNRLKVLPLKRFKQDKKRPCLKASGGQIRALVPYFLKLAQSWPLQDIPQDLVPEVELVQGAMADLERCYQTLSKSYGPGASSDLKCHSIRFAEQLVRLSVLKEARYSLPPKLHMWLELCAEGANPSLSWNYREEDFGGCLASMARRKGGRESGLATSMNCLQGFMLKQPLPTFLGQSAQGSGGAVLPSACAHFSAA